MGGTYANDSKEIQELTPDERLWIQQYRHTVEEIGPDAAASCVGRNGHDVPDDNGEAA